MTNPAASGPVIRPPEAEAALADPATSPQVLALIAAQYPSLRDRIAQHPRAYPALLEWLDTAQPESGSPPPPSDPSVPPVPGPPVDPARSVEPVPSVEPAPSRRWAWITAIVVVLVVAALVVTAVSWHPWVSTPAPYPSVSPPPAAQSPSANTPAPSATAPSGETGMVSGYAGTATQDGATTKAWQVTIALYQGYGLIDYSRGTKTCSGVLLHASGAAWQERITQGTCDDGGVWTLSGIGSDRLSGSYQPPRGSYTVQIALARSMQGSSAEISTAVATQGCTTEATQPISTIVVIGESTIGLVAHPGSEVWVLRGPRSAPQQQIKLIADDDGIDVDFASATSNHATLVIDC